MKTLAWILSTITEEYEAIRRNIHCIRNGHNTLDVSDGHVCRHCGRFWA